MTHLQTSRNTPTTDCVNPRGFTLIEAVMSMLVVGLMLVAALNTVGASRVTQSRTAEQAVGPMLAEDLMSEILGQLYEEPVDTVEFGRESSESGGERTGWDDVDDYDGWSKSPPQNKDGTDIPDLAGWGRTVTVQWVKPTILNDVGANTGIKRIDVKVTHQGRVVSELTVVRTMGWSDDQYQDVYVPTPSVLFVVTNAAAPTVEELACRVLMELWGFSVELITAAASQSAFDNAVDRNDVAYIHEEVASGDLNTKLKSATIGVVIEEMTLTDEYGISSFNGSFTSDTIKITNNGHYITQGFTTGDQTILTSPSWLTTSTGTLGGGVSTLATQAIGFDAVLTVIDTGGALFGGGNAAGRRVHLPWGTNDFDGQLLNADGKTLMRRAIEWAADMEQP